MPTEQLLRILISLGLGFAIGTADLAGLFLTVKYSFKRDGKNKIPLAFFISEMIRLIIVLALLLFLSFHRQFSFLWLAVGPLALTLVKYVYAFRKMTQL
jgi:hypothetical protein